MRGQEPIAVIIDETTAMKELPMFDRAMETIRELENFWGDFEPAAPFNYVNGRLPMSALSSIGNGYYLEKEAAAAFNAMRDEIHRRTGFWISVISAYRTISQQEYLWDHVAHAHDTNWVARPGTSNHGLGVAIDLANQTSRHYVDLYGAPYGWSKRWSDAPVEWWHIKYQTGHYKGHTGPPTLRPGSKGVWVQRARNAMRHKNVSVYPTGRKYGPDMKRSVIRFQKKHKLKADGVIGPATWHALGIK
jgi:hypothetical protein